MKTALTEVSTATVTVVVGDENAIKVHIHVKNPGEPLTYGISLGLITDVVVENMQMQMEGIIHAPAATSAMPEVEQVMVQPGQVGVVAVAAGQGLSDIFRSLGAASIVEGGQTNNPSIEEIFQAVQDVPNMPIPDIETIQEVAVVPTRNAPQGFCALLALNPDGDLNATAENMYEAAQQISTGEITRATRSVTLDGVACNDGEFIGLVDGRLAASGIELDNVLVQVLENMDVEEREIISVYRGEDVTAQEADKVGSLIESLYPELEVELLPGEQAHYFYILGAE